MIEQVFGFQVEVDVFKMLGIFEKSFGNCLYVFGIFSWIFSKFLGNFLNDFLRIFWEDFLGGFIWENY